MRDSQTPLRAHRRGFFFTVMALAILSFMLLTVQLWVRVFEQSDINAAGRFKGEAMRQVLTTLSDKALSDFANASSFYATYKLANYSMATGIAPAGSADQNNPYTGRVEENIKLLMLNGTSQADMPPQVIYSNSEREAYTLSSWQNRVQEAANLMGFNTSFSEPRNFNISQTDPWTVGVYFEVEMNISDLEGTMRQSKTLKANSSFSIVGFADPSITRSYRSPSFYPFSTLSGAPQKQIFRNEIYNSPGDLWPVHQDGYSGNGWFFGPVTDKYPDQIGENDSEWGRLSQFVLVRHYNDSMPSYADQYGAVIVINKPILKTIENVPMSGCLYNVTQETECLNCRRTYASTDPNCPRLPAEYTNTVGVPTLSGASVQSPAVNREGVDKYQYVLIDNAYENYNNAGGGNYHRLWDVTAIRDMAICGFYVSEPSAPSFFQRMLAEPFSTPGINSTYGIESFVVGQWAGGADDLPHAGRSRLDSEFFSSVGSNTFGIKGMMGCKSKEMCAGGTSNNATTQGVGVFRLSEEAFKRYGLEAIACGYGADPSSPCE